LGSSVLVKGPKKKRRALKGVGAPYFHVHILSGGGLVSLRGVLGCLTGSDSSHALGALVYHVIRSFHSNMLKITRLFVCLLFACFLLASTMPFSEN